MATSTRPGPDVELRDTQIKRPPKLVQDRVKRGRARLEKIASKRNECFEFWRGNQYCYLSDEGLLVQQSTTVAASGRGKPAHRVRTTRNLIADFVQHEVAAATQRVPSYEISPSTVDPEDVAAARLSQKVALYGYDKWQLRRVTEDVVTHAVVGDEGFAWPYFDPTKGPTVDEEDGIGEGEVQVRVFGGNEVYWEPGCQFEDSPWHVVEQARTMHDAYSLPGFLGGKLTPDANSNAIVGKPKPEPNTKMVLVTDYLQRPSKAAPKGMWLTVANERLICEPQIYPCDGDRPVLHKLTYFRDPDSDRDSGLVRHLIDAQRTYNDCVNKMLEWKNLALNPQVFLLNGRLDARLTDEPGAIYKVFGNNPPVWRPVPPVPRELFEIANQALNDMARIAAQNDIPNQVDSGKGVQALIERDQSRKASFIANLAEWHSDLMRAALYLVQKHYTEQRVLKIRGRTGPEMLSGFRGADLRDQVDVRVAPGSITPRTQQAIVERTLALADRGWISPQAAMASMNGGTAEGLAQSYELDIARAHRIIQRIKEGPEALFGGREQPTGRLDMNGAPEMAPAWMPRRSDNLDVHKMVFEDFMKTEEYEQLEPGMQEAVVQYYAGLMQLEAEKQAEQMAAQAAQAEQLGMENAARPQGAKPSPDQPKPPVKPGEGLKAPTPNQPSDQHGAARAQ